MAAEIWTITPRLTASGKLPPSWDFHIRAVLDRDTNWRRPGEWTAAATVEGLNPQVGRGTLGLTAALTHQEETAGG